MDRLDHDQPTVITGALGVLKDQDLSEGLHARVVELLEHEDATVVGDVLLVLEGRELSEAVISRVIGSLARRDLSISGAHSVLREQNLAEHVLHRIGDLFGHGNSSVVASALELLHGRDLPPDVLAKVVGLLGHGDPAVVWSALSVLDGRHLPEPLVSDGVSRLLGAGEVNTRALSRFLRGRPLSGQAALTLNSWLATDPLNRWPVAMELKWPPHLAPRLAVHVRAMAAVKALAEVAAFNGLVAETAERWLANEHEEPWAEVARAAERPRAPGDHDPGPRTGRLAT